MILTHLVLFGFFPGAGEGSAPPPTPTVTVEVGGIGRKRRHPETVVYEEREEAPDLSAFEVPVKVEKAIRKVLDKAPPDDGAAIKALRNELSRLKVRYKPRYAEALRSAFDPVAAFELKLRQEEEEDIEVILMVLH